MEGRMVEIVDCRCGSTWNGNWMVGRKREGRARIGLDWIAYWKNFRDTPTTTNHDTYLPFFQTQKYNVTFVKLVKSLSYCHTQRVFFSQVAIRFSSEISLLYLLASAYILVCGATKREAECHACMQSFFSGDDFSGTRTHDLFFLFHFRLVVLSAACSRCYLSGRGGSESSYVYIRRAASQGPG